MLLLCSHPPSSFVLGKIAIFKAQLHLRISMFGNKGWWVKVPVSAGLEKCRELRDTGEENRS